jgi:putative peptidoglycan lipid II flippase
MQPADTALLGSTLAAFAVGLPWFSAFQLLTRTFYATQDARSPALANIVVCVVNLAADLWLAFGLDLGVRGLALGFGASYVAGTVILTIRLRGRLDGLDARRVLMTLGRTLGASALVALAAWGAVQGVAAVMESGRPLFSLAQVTAGVVAGVLAFVLGALIFQIEEADEVWRALAARFRR